MMRDLVSIFLRKLEMRKNLKSCIEKLCENSHPIISPIGFKELFRKEKLEQDLSFYFGSKWSE